MRRKPPSLARTLRRAGWVEEPLAIEDILESCIYIYIYTCVYIYIHIDIHRITILHIHIILSMYHFPLRRRCRSPWNLSAKCWIQWGGQARKAQTNHSKQIKAPWHWLFLQFGHWECQSFFDKKFGFFMNFWGSELDFFLYFWRSLFWISGNAWQDLANLDILDILDI